MKAFYFFLSLWLCLVARHKTDWDKLEAIIKEEVGVSWS
jgi:hypothetical protein